MKVIYFLVLDALSWIPMVVNALVWIPTLQLQRFKTYTFLLQSKMSSFPELEPSLVEVAIGEVDEPPSSPPGPSGDEKRGRPVQRSMSDRYSYRAAIYSHETHDYDMLWPWGGVFDTLRWRVLTPCTLRWGAACANASHALP